MIVGMGVGVVVRSLVRIFIRVWVRGGGSMGLSRSSRIVVLVISSSNL